MCEWSEKLKIGKGSPFVKRDLRPLPLTDAEFEADFWFDAESSTKRCEVWKGMVIEREFAAVLAMKNVDWPPPTVNDLALLLFHAMTRPLTAGDCQRPRAVHLRDRPQWQEVFPHLQQLGIGIELGPDLPWFDNAVIDWMQHRKTKRLPSAHETRATLRKPFPERKRTWFTDAMDLMEWTDAMSKAAYPSHNVAVPRYSPMTVVPIQLRADELEAILTNTEIANTRKLRPRLETMAAESEAIALEIQDWSRVLLALCGAKAKKNSVSQPLLGIARRIANHLAEALGIDDPRLRT